MQPSRIASARLTTLLVYNESCRVSLPNAVSSNHSASIPPMRYFAALSRVGTIRDTVFWIFRRTRWSNAEREIRPPNVCCIVVLSPNWPSPAPLLRNLRCSDDRAERVHPFARTPQTRNGLWGGQAILSQRPGGRRIQSSRFGKQRRST